jgi:hypothetical protein
MALWRGSACIYVFATVHNPLVSYDTDESKHHDLIYVLFLAWVMLLGRVLRRRTRRLHPASSIKTATTVTRLISVACRLLDRF